MNAADPGQDPCRAVTTNVVYSSPLKNRPVTTAALGAADPGAGNAL